MNDCDADKCCYLPSTLVATNAWCDVPPVLFSLGIISRQQESGEKPIAPP